MEMNEVEQKAVKAIYNDYYSKEISAEQALHDLEMLINNNEVVERCPLCKAQIDENNPLIDAERYSVSDKIGYCDNCYDPTPD